MEEYAAALRGRAPEKQNKRALYGVIFLHGFNDMHSTALPTIIPMLAQSISLTMSQAGILSALFGTMNILLQPIAGYIADGLKRPWLAAFGPLLSITGASLLSLSPSFGAALLCIGLMSIGTSLFHPQGTGGCGAAADKKRLAFFLSLFQASGTVGSAIGPLYVVFMISMFGRRGFPLIMIPAALLICFFLLRNMGEIPTGGAEEKEGKSAGSFAHYLCFLLSRVGWIVAITSVRDAVFQAIKVFTPTLFVQRGSSIAMGGAVLFAVTLTAALAGIVGGRLADGVGEKKVVFGAIAIAPVFLIFGVRDYGMLSTASLMAGYAFLQASTPVTLAMAQRRCPESRSLASSLTNGVSWGLANLFVTPVGVLADHIGLQATLDLVAFLPWSVTLWYGAKTLAARNRAA